MYHSLATCNKLHLNLKMPFEIHQTCKINFHLFFVSLFLDLMPKHSIKRLWLLIIVDCSPQKIEAVIEYFYNSGAVNLKIDLIVISRYISNLRFILFILTSLSYGSQNILQLMKVRVS